MKLRFFLFSLVLLFAQAEIHAQVVTKPVVIMSQVSGKCLTIENASAANNAAAIQYTCNAGANAKFRLEPIGAGYRFVLAHSGKCLNVAFNSQTNGGEIIQYTCEGGANEIFTLEPIGKNYRIRSASSNKCMNIFGATQDQNAKLVQWDCNEDNNELFSFGDGFIPADRPVKLVHSASKLCADVNGASAAQGSKLIHWPCKEGPNAAVANQVVSMKRAADGYTLTFQHSNQCVDVANGSAADNADVIQWPCHGGANQIWLAKAVANGFQIVNKNSNKCLALLTTGGAQGTTLTQKACDATPNSTWKISTEGQLGSWTPLVGTPLVPVAAANLPNGKILLWSAWDKFQFGGANGHTQTGLFNPDTGVTEEFDIASTQHDMFCPGTALITDGRLVINGGSNAEKTSVYNYQNNSWADGGNMHTARGYNASVPLSDGRVFTIGGSWSGPAELKKDGEVWASGQGWTKLTGVPADRMTGIDWQGVYRGDNHAWLFGTANGMVFHAGPSPQMNWFSTAGAGSFTAAGNRGDDGYAMDGNAIMYDVGKILKVGGAPAYQERDANGASYTIDINGGAVNVAKLPNLAFARGFHNSVVLPNGQVFIGGGQSYPVPFSDATSVLETELFNPATNNFSLSASMDVPRTYHSVALLLPDARVFMAGGGLCGGCTNNHADVQYYLPPYLYAANGELAARPVIQTAPAQVGFAQNFQVQTNAPVSSFSLVRLASVTHSTNNDQRRVPLTIVNANGNTITLQSPANSGVATPGYYMLFAMNAAGTPSVAKIVQVR